MSMFYMKPYLYFWERPGWYLLGWKRFWTHVVEKIKHTCIAKHEPRALEVSPYTECTAGSVTLYWTYRWKCHPILNVPLEVSPYTVRTAGSVTLYCTYRWKCHRILYVPLATSS